MARLIFALAMTTALQGPPALAQGEPAGVRSRYGKQLAVIVGINYGGSNNKEFLPKLKNAQNDAEAVAGRLKESYGYEDANIKVLLGPQADKAKIEEALNEVLDVAGPDDSILFYFSGHGERPNDGFEEPYGILVPFDAKGIDLGGQQSVNPRWCISFEGLIRDKLRTGKARHSLVLLDCCYSGQILGTPRGTRSLKLDTFDRDGFQAKGIQAMTAGLANKQVQDGSGDHSPFTQSLLQALEETPRGLPARADSFTADLLFNSVQDRMKDLIGAGRARPLFGNVPFPNNSDEANFHFFPSASARKPVAKAVAAPALEALRFDLYSMTGLNGQWWFDETPWLIPSLRAEMGIDSELTSLRLESGPDVAVRGTASKPVSAFLDTNIESVHRLLREQMERKGLLRNRDDPGSRLVRDLLDQPDQVQERELQGYAEQLRESLEEADTLRPMDRHLLAVLQHKLNLNTASDSYRRAILDYAEYTKKTPGIKGLHALCVSDLGRLLFSQYRYKEAIEQFRLAEKIIEEQSTVFYLDCLCNRGEAHRRLGQWVNSQGCLSRAVGLAKGHLQPHHPLTAFVHEKAAWTDFEMWRISNARRSFEQAELVYDGTGTSDLTDQAQITRFRIMHGRAMAERYAGCLVEARQRFEKIESEIERYISDRRAADGMTALVEQALRDRQVNTKERRAESYLFAGEPELAVTILEDAIELAKLLSADRREAVLFQLYIKNTIALALADRGDKGADARNALRHAGNQRLMLDQFQIMQSYIKLAEALTRRAEEGDYRPLKEHVALAMTQNLETVRRDDLELLLLANRELGGDESSTVNLKRLLKVILKEDPAVRAFARPYFNAAIRNLALSTTGNRVDLVRWIFEARTGNDFTDLEDLRKNNALLWHAEDSFGVAILFPRGGKPVVSTFKVGLSHWKNRPKDQLLSPPWGEDFEQHLKKIEGPISVYWADPVLELGDDVYPFAYPLKEKCQFSSYLSATTPTVRTTVAKPKY